MSRMPQRLATSRNACTPLTVHRLPRTAYRAQRRGSQRQPKDPQQFRDWEDIRSSLHEGEQGFVSGVISFLSGSAFGRPDKCGVRAGMTMHTGCTPVLQQHHSTLLMHGLIAVGP